MVPKLADRNSLNRESKAKRTASVRTRKLPEVHEENQQGRNPTRNIRV